MIKIGYSYWKLEIVIKFIYILWLVLNLDKIKCRIGIDLFIIILKMLLLL